MLGDIWRFSYQRIRENAPLVTKQKSLDQKDLPYEIGKIQISFFFWPTKYFINWRSTLLAFSKR